MCLQAFGNMDQTQPNLHQLGYKEKAWAVNKLGAVATAHGLPELSLHMLNTLYGYNAMEVQVSACLVFRSQGVSDALSWGLGSRGY